MKMHKKNAAHGAPIHSVVYLSKAVRRAFTEAAVRGDYLRAAKMITQNHLLLGVEKQTGLDRHEVRGFGRGRLHPSKKKRRKICAYAMYIGS